MSSMAVETLFVGARVIDPESGLDGPRQVGVRDGVITYVGSEHVPAESTVDVSGLVLCPGFIDMHSHAQSVNGLRLQALDGVTTSLDLESGTLPVPLTYELAAAEGRPINYGYAASWAMARLHVVDDVPMPARSASGEAPTALDVFQARQTAARWNAVATPAEVDRMLALLEEGVADGAIGIGVLLGYAPDTGRAEYFRTAQLASRLGVGVFTHSRAKSNVEPVTSLEGALEIVGAAAGTGASMHICHLNSTSLRQIDDIAAAIEAARGLGNRITTEAYPYTASSTGVGAAFLAPEKLHRIGIEPKDITYLPTGERIADADRLAELRATNPGGLCIIDYLRADDPADLDALLGSITLADTAVASDAMPLVLDGERDHGTQWPPDPRAIAHPRSAGCFARALSWLTRELGVFSLPETIRRCTLLPAQILEETAPAMRRKGRVQVGADADIAVFDPETVAEGASYERIGPSTGFRHVVVNGEFVVADGELVVSALPGRPVKGRGR
jgi:N-acyl-D-aspartate/D-glutamate deacylase